MPGEPYDTFHDYRPDPDFKVKSHLYRGVADSRDESGIFSDELASVVSRGEGLLAYFHDRFYLEFLDVLGTDFAEPPADAPAAESSPAEQWANMSLDARISVVRKMTWDRLLKNTALLFAEAEEDMEPDNTTDWHMAYINFYPYLETIYRKLPDYFLVKDFFLELKTLRISGLYRTLTDAVDEGEAQALGKKIMWGLIAFRNTYLNFMFKTLRDGGLKITHIMVGSIDITSDYDVILGGKDDAAAACEFYRAFRAEWRVEPGTMLDANLYCRNWMTIADQTMHPSEGNAKDTSLQARALDYIGDMYGLLKIRRHSSKVEWAAFNNAVMRHIKVDGLAEPDLAEVYNTYTLQGSGLPMFKRLDRVDEMYRDQFVKPLLTRAGDIWARFKKDMKDTLGDRVNKPTPRTLKRLFEYDKDGMLRTMTIAYMELIAKLRKVEIDLKRDHPGDFKWYQNDVTTEGDGALKEYKQINPAGSGISAEGMARFLEQSSLLISEGLLFAIEPYYTQGAMWSVVGGGLTQLKEHITIHHRLQCFNEQIGDALKELREHLREMEYDEEEKISKLRIDELWGKLIVAEEGDDYAQALKEYESEWLKYDHIEKNIKDKHTGAGFYRASKYEERLVAELTRIIENLKADPVIAKRKAIHDKLFPGSSADQEPNFEALKLELKIGKMFEDNVKELKAIRKSKDTEKAEYSKMTNEEKIQAAIALVDEVVNDDSEFSKLVNDPLREDAEIDYVAASPKGRMNKYTPRPLPGENKNAWGLRHLIHHLLWHGAAVNRNVRLLLSRGPLEITVKNMAEN